MSGNEWDTSKQSTIIPPVLYHNTAALSTGAAGKAQEMGQMIGFKPPRMLGIKETAEVFGLPVHFVRQKAASGEIVAVKAGRRYLINADRFADYLNSNVIQTEKAEPVKGITPINL